ncbi:MAG TPA: class I SAM-dependent methyltransferase [Rhodocyclaceae bacterium]|jgi:adenine-specific DNA-methyltransferase|nr:class I SAM-dependent methyltransferase [Rhodocyclaceae bacterium]
MNALTQFELDVTRKGQVFTPPEIVARMLALRRNAGRVLEPSCGDGAFLAALPDAVALEMDPAIAPPQAQVMDFFAYPESEKFDTIIGNPPYVRARDVLPATAKNLSSQLLDGHANLYLHFIEKCVRHLKPGGELIFITPRDFLKSTGAGQLNTWLFDQGTVTDTIDLGDVRIFKGAAPNCMIWRFERGNMSRRTADGRRMALSGGQLFFTRGIYSVPASTVFSVKVGAVSGADVIFSNAELGDADFVCSHTGQTGETRRMIFAAPSQESRKYLEQHKEALLARRVARFGEDNWWKWGRFHHQTDAPRIYVNQKTRNTQPFFTHECRNYDGAVLALFPHRRDADIAALTAQLNSVDWGELGFVCDGRFLFAQRSLEQTLLPEDFITYAVRGLV